MKCLFIFPLIFFLLHSSTVFSQNPNMFEFKIDCRIPSDICDSIVIYNQAGQIISDNLVLTSKITVNVFVDQLPDVNYNGGASPETIRYVDPEDGVTRMYAQALVRQLDPNFKSDTPDINMEVNIYREGYFWFQDANEGPIQPNQLDFLEFVLHELHHGLGIQSYWRPHQDDHIGVGLLPYFYYTYDNSGKLIFNAFYETVFDKFLVSMRGGELVKTYTKALNDIAGPPGRQYNDFNDFFTQLRDKQQQGGRSYSMDMSVIATNQFRLGFLITIDDASVNSAEVASEAILLESSYNPFEFGKSIQHLSNDYDSTDDFLFISVPRTGFTLQEQITANGDYPGGGVGPSLFIMLESIGYKLRLPPRRRKPSTKISKISN